MSVLFSWILIYHFLPIFVIFLHLISILLFCSPRNRKDQRQQSSGAPLAQPPEGGYKPGHLPEFADADQKETNTFYDVISAVAFPLKDEDGKLIQTTPTPEPTRKDSTTGAAVTPQLSKQEKPN
uniref:Uncharacterized protein n=1 Tax=Panagrolaimus sp. JU765 TaxID=591449 RepID=A0AC34Q0G0_9BILA